MLWHGTGSRSVESQNCKDSIFSLSLSFLWFKETIANFRKTLKLLAMNFEKHINEVLKTKSIESHFDAYFWVNAWFFSIIRKTIVNFRKTCNTYWQWFYKSFLTECWSKKSIEPSRSMVNFDAHFRVNVRFFLIIRKTVKNFRKNYNTYWQWFFKSFPMICLLLK